MDDSPPSPSPPGRAWRIAVVDDYSIIRCVFKSLVEDDPGLQFTWSAATLAEARSKLARTVPDLMIVDISLPDGEGYELICETLDSLPDLQILVVSAFESPAHARRARECGAKGYLTKNSSPGDILEAISTIQKGGTCFKMLSGPAAQAKQENTAQQDCVKR